MEELAAALSIMTSLCFASTLRKAKVSKRKAKLEKKKEKTKTKEEKVNQKC